MSAFKQASLVPRKELLLSSLESKKQTTDRTVLVLTYHPHNVAVKNILLDNFGILQSDPKLKDVFQKPPLVAYKKDKSIRDHLVHSSFKHPCSNQPMGNKCCQKPGCKTCPFLDTRTTILTGPSGKTFEIRSAFTCVSSNLVYIIVCSLCKKMYCGETYRTLNERFKEHLQSVYQQKDNPVGNHFNSPGHNVHHMKVCAAHQNYTDWVHRKFLESSLISRLGTIAPCGLNVRE